MDKTALEDDTKLDLTADHVHPLLLSREEATDLVNEGSGNNDLDDMLNTALDYMEAEGKDAILVITIKRD